MVMRRRLACCTRDREISIDMDEPDRITTYNGLETYILNNQSYEDESGCPTDSLYDDNDSSCSSSKDASGSFSSKSSKWLATKNCELSDESESPQHLYLNEKPVYSIQSSDVEAMREKFAKLLLGEDITGGCKGVTSALALSNAITNLAASVFGELWKLEPLPEEKKKKWKIEMDWLLSPTNYMVELVPGKQNGANGRTMEIMTPKTRADILMNLPALQKLDAMLIELLDSMVDTEFWYDEVGRRAEGRSKSTKESKRWWLPSPQVPKTGLASAESKNLLYKGKVVHQVFKAANSINENVLLEMPVPAVIKDAIPKSGKENLGEELYKVLNAESSSTAEMLNSIKLGSEHAALETVNRLEAAILAWKEKSAEQISTKSPSWSFIKGSVSELDRWGLLCEQAEALVQQIKSRYPNLPQSFLDAKKIQYGVDIGHSIVEAYSRVLRNLAFSILSRIGEILQEDVLSNPNSPAVTSYLLGMKESPTHNIDSYDLQLLCDKAKQNSKQSKWSIGEEVCTILN